MEWTGCTRCEKFGRDFVWRTCAIMSRVRPVLHQLSCSNEAARNAPKHEFRVKWSGLGAFVAKNCRRICELDKLSLRDLVKRQRTARLSTRRTTETITLPRNNITAHAITPYRREGTNWVNRSSAFYDSLRNRKNKYCKPLKTHA
jgi:hypothetical protein